MSKKNKSKKKDVVTLADSLSLGAAQDSPAWTDRLVRDVWPQERDFMERPERFRYVRKLIPQKGCVFCAAAKKGVSEKSLVLYLDEHVMVIMNKYPYNTGHLLVIPTVHEGELWELADETNTAISAWIKKVAKILSDEMGCAGLNMGMNHGKVAGAGIPDHLHWHVIPRWGGDTNFFPLIAETKALPETLEQTYARLAPYFKERRPKDGKKPKKRG